MKVGDTIRLKEDFNVMLNYGDIGFQIAGGTEGQLIQTNSNDARFLVGFKINKTIMVTAWLFPDTFDGH